MKLIMIAVPALQLHYSLAHIKLIIRKNFSKFYIKIKAKINKCHKKDIKIDKKA